MLETITGIFDYLVGVQVHPIVTAAVLVVLAVGRQRYEETEPDPIKKRLMSRRIFHAMIGVSFIAQLAFYWPQNLQAIAICLIFAIVQVGIASFINTYLEKWGIMDRVGRIVQKKLDDKGGVINGPGAV